MVKFILVLQICHTLSNVCDNPISNQQIYNSYKECGIDGYKKSYEIMNFLDEKDLNENRTVIRFWCEEIKNA